MIDIISLSTDVMNDAQFDTTPSTVGERKALIFEDPTIFGFLFPYENSTQLLKNWEKDMNRAISENQFGLRRSAQKAWNLYTVFLTSNIDSPSHTSALTAIEENLTGSRKIARGHIKDSLDLREALLILLPLQAAPHLEAVDMSLEIRQRATELNTRSIEAFLSTSDEAVVLQVLEEES